MYLVNIQDVPKFAKRADLKRLLESFEEVISFSMNRDHNSAIVKFRKLNTAKAFTFSNPVLHGVPVRTSLVKD